MRRPSAVAVGSASAAVALALGTAKLLKPSSPAPAPAAQVALTPEQADLVSIEYSVYGPVLRVKAIMTGEPGGRFPAISVQAGAAGELPLRPWDSFTLPVHGDVVPIPTRRYLLWPSGGAVKVNVDYGTYSWTYWYQPWGENVTVDFHLPSFTAIDIAGWHNADFDMNGFVNGDDADAFYAAFQAGDRKADVNGDGFVNGDDADLFHQAFAAG